MTYFLRNFELFPETKQSVSSSPNASLKRLLREQSIADPRATSFHYAQLLKFCAKLPPHGYILRFPATRKRSPYSSFDFDVEEGGEHRRLLIIGDGRDGGEGTTENFEAATLDLGSCLEVLAAPSPFGATAIARSIVLRNVPLLKATLSSCAEQNLDNQPIVEMRTDIGNDGLQGPGNGNEIVLLSLKCMFSVLHELNKRDSELCSEALNSLLHLTEQITVESLSNESYHFICTMHSTLYRLAVDGSPEVSSKASSCMVALSVAYGASEFLLSTAATLLCDRPKNISSNSALYISVPHNYHKLASLVRRVLLRNSDEPGSAGDWWSHCVSEHSILSSFDIKIPNDSLPETPDDRRLSGAIASDGEYIYVLMCQGLFKYGTGLAETIEGKLYAANHLLKANKGSWLAVCCGSLYLRRRQSSRMWVIDIDTLNEIGEIILHTSASFGTILTDSSTFFHANIDEQWNFIVTPLDDSFTPVKDPRQVQKFRLAVMNYVATGETHPIPHELPMSLPKSLQAQASDLQIGRDIALLLARNGKVYYAGDGSRMGLQDVGSNWMELVLPESVVSIAVGTDTETIVLRSGSGHLWIAGIGPETVCQGSPAAGRFQKQEAGSAAVKLRKFQVLNRRKCVSVAVSSGCIAYVTDNGKAYVCGRHTMQCHPETGYIYGLENVHLATIALGKTHAVAVTRHGHLYTWGLNNLNQCGRTETLGGVTRTEGLDDNQLGPTVSSQNTDFEQSGPYCPYNEHLWVKDFASICLRCGKCSARGKRCPPVRLDGEHRFRGTLCGCGEGETCCLRCGICRECGESAREHIVRERRETSPRATLFPARLLLQKTSPGVKVSSVSCGNYHTVVLAADRQVFTFGSNCHGQLGIGHVMKSVGPHKVELPGKVQVAQVAAGANHTVLRTADGSVLTFGAYRQGQLAREGSEKNWFAVPSYVSGYGRGCGTVATWIGAAGDTTLIHSQARIYSSDVISDCQIVANQDAVLIFPNQVGKDYMAIKRKSNIFYQYSLGAEGLYTSWCLEPKYNLLWSFNVAEMRVKSISSCTSHFQELNNEQETSQQNEIETLKREIGFLRAPEFMLPDDSEVAVTTKQLGLNMLGTVYVATILESKKKKEQKVEIPEQEQKSMIQGCGRGLSSGYMRVNRFEGNGGGWGYSAHSVEAIQFRTSRDIRFFGIGLFGGRGEYIAKLKLYRLCPPDYDEQNVELLCESDEMIYECAAHERAQLLFPRGILIKTNSWHVICAQINGPSSDCGAGGQSNVAGEDGVQFFFRNSRMSNNGTDISVGQIPEFLYTSEPMNDRMPNIDSKYKTAEMSYDTISSVINPHNLLSASTGSIENLFRLLDWSIQKALTDDDPTQEDAVWVKERYMIVAIIALKYLRCYICSLYSVSRNRDRGDVKEPSVDIAVQMVQFASIISSLFEIASAELSNENSTRVILLEETVDCVVMCSHVLYPTSAIILDRLAFLMSTPNRDWSLIALLSALSCQEYILPILLGSEREPSYYPFPILLTKMTEQFGRKVSTNRQHFVTFQNVLRFLFEIAFTPSSTCLQSSCRNDSKSRLKEAAHSLIISIASELVTPKDAVGGGPPILQTPNRFRKTAAHASWDVSSDAADAIAFSVDVSEVTLHGVGVYCSHHDQQHNFVCEVLHNAGDAAHEQWNVLEKVLGTLSNKFEPCRREVAMLRLTKAIPLKPGSTYAIRLQINGGKTFCGEGGVGTVRLCNGSRLHFEPCSLSLNGTSLARGQIPFLLYSIQDADNEVVQKLADSEQISTWFLLLVRMLSSKISDLIAVGNVSTMDRALCSSIAGYIMVFLEAYPQRSLDIVTTLDDLLPMVSSANGEKLAEEPERTLPRSETSTESLQSSQVVVESPHPYSSCSVHSQIVDFGKSVVFMTIQFSEECCTAQADDVLWVYAKVDVDCYVPVGRYCGDRNWPDRMLLIPGNNLWFIFESSSHTEDKNSNEVYGYRCTVIGYLLSEKDSNAALEEELTWICANACRLLVQIPSDKAVIRAVSMAEEEINDIVQKHGSLLRKGLNLSHIPTVNEVLKRSLPSPSPTSDLRFLKEFIAGSASTVAGFLARWMISEAVVDLQSSYLQLPDEETQLRRATQIRFVPNDQFGRPAFCELMNVQITVRSGIASDDSSSQLSVAAGSLKATSNKPQMPSLKEPYRPVYVNRARYVSITMMPAYSNYSFEELRLVCYKEAMLKEKLNVLRQNDGSYLAEWTPNHAGTYRIECRVDGFQLMQSYLVEVNDEYGVFGPSLVGRNVHVRSNRRRVAHLSRTRFAVCDQKLMTKGIRIRASPALNAMQIGVIPRGAVITFIEEVENNDGIWLRLTDETCAMHCDTQLSIQAWCMQYSIHHDRHFMTIQSDSPETAIPERGISSTTVQIPQGVVSSEHCLEHSLQMDAEEVYTFCDEQPLTLYSYPSLDSACGEMFDTSNEKEVRSDGWLHNKQGVWIRLPDYDQKYAHVQDLAGNCYLQKVNLSQRCKKGNSNDGSPVHRPVAQIQPRSRNEQPVKALRPSVVDCCRSVFAAFLWHERLVKDAMVCSTYLKFHPELHTVTRGQNKLESLVSTPLHFLLGLWQEISTTVQTSIQQHLVLSSPMATRKFNLKPISSNLGIARQSSSASKKEDLCELCEEYHLQPVTTHMRMAHPGCGRNCGGQGYNSSGKYTSGWSGNCGEGGRPSAVWYLMCTNCRARYLMQTSTGHQQERSRRWREFCTSSAANDISSEMVIKQNAMFLLELNSCMDGDSKETSTATSGWTINLFPQTSVTPPVIGSTCTQTVDGLRSHPMSANERDGRWTSHTMSHASDPGPKQVSGMNNPVSSHNTLRSKHRLGSSPLAVAPNTSELLLSIRRRMIEGYERRQSAEIVRSPSVALKSLLQNSEHMSINCSRSSSANLTASFRRPVLAFVNERHDLARIREAMATAIARATFFAHSFRVWNWLLKLVSAESSVSDILWQYLTALNSYAPLCRRRRDVRLATSLRLLPHPWRVCYLAGPIANRMVHQMHSFLHTVAVIVQSSGVESNLHCLCFRAWTFQLTVHEQDLLSLICDILASVGTVLSDPSSDRSWNTDDSDKKAEWHLQREEQTSDGDKHRTNVGELEDITSMVRCEASSRQTMIGCLTDGSSDTFWESGDEDKNRSRTLTIRLNSRNFGAALLTVFLDNIRDEGYRTSLITVAAPDGEANRRIIHMEHLDQQFIGWIKCCIAGLSRVQIFFRGSDPSVRIRQLRVFGGSVDVDPLSTLPSLNRNLLKPSPSHQLLFSAAQSDAFALFQSIAAQAFSDEFSHEENGTLRQQVLDLLFTRVQLQPLQAFVCSQMIKALEREVSSLRDKVKRNYSYACGLMVMLVKICGSRQGLEIFGVKNNVLPTLTELLLFAPQVVQCQIIETIERLTKLFKPSAVDCTYFTQNLLAVIAKVITLQIRDKLTRSLTSTCLTTHCTDAPLHWRIDRLITSDIGLLTKQLLSNLCEGLLNEQWMIPIRTEIANQIMCFANVSVTPSDSGEKTSSEIHCASELLMGGSSWMAMLKNGKFWLSVAALSLLSDSQWLQLSSIWQSFQDKKEGITETLCDNHDDGRTLANVYCEVCQCSLCRECFAVLHLNKRNRSHGVQILGVSNGCPQVEVHEGSTRLRLPHLLILFHPSTLNGVAEFSQSTLKESLPSTFYSRNTESTLLTAQVNVRRGCRFCANPLKQENQLDAVCEHEECRQLAEFACQRQLSCGHFCVGIRDELECLPCLHCARPDARQDADDLCVICFTDRLGAAPCIQLTCQHIFHYRCVKAVLEKRWSGPRIVFRFMQCPLCRRQIDHPSMSDLLVPLQALYEEVLRKARMRLEYDGLLQCPAIISESSEFHNNAAEYAMDRYMYVLCFKCGKAYFGGESRCQQALDHSQYNPAELVCGGCSDTVGAQVCGRHGVDYLEFKCRFCCSVAVYFCFGTTHFCAACHDDFQRLICLPKHLLPKCPVGPRGSQLDGNECPLRIQHPPTGEEFPLGCGICRNISTF